LFALLPLVACWRYEPREHLRPLAIARAAIPPSPLRDRVGYSDHDRFRGYVPVHCRSGLQPPCLRFAAAVTGRHARLGSRLLARLCRGRHRRRQTSTRLQGATRTDPYEPNSGIRLRDAGEGGQKDTQSVVSALIKQARKLPSELYKSLTWDRGKELSDHRRFTLATNIDVYFCDPQSPWQRGSNENTDGLLRQYFRRAPTCRCIRKPI
jgi:hypothetical protein